MNVSKNVHVSKVALDEARKFIEAKDYHRALENLSSAYSLVRKLCEHVWLLRREQALSTSPSKKNTG